MIYKFARVQLSDLVCSINAITHLFLAGVRYYKVYSFWPTDPYLSGTLCISVDFIFSEFHSQNRCVVFL